MAYGIDYCCLSIVKRDNEDKIWKSILFGDATHIGLGTTEILDDWLYNFINI